MIDRSQVQVSLQWAKVTYNGKVKRISRPSQELACFVGQVRAHFKELADVEYLHPLSEPTITEESKLTAESDKASVAKFVLRWYSHSPTDASILDQSCHAVDISNTDQFLEIFCTHAIVDRNNGIVSTPRFTVHVTGKLVVKKREEIGSSISPILKQELLTGVKVEISNAEEMKQPQLGEEAGCQKQESQVVDVVKSMFAEDAEEAVSVEYDQNNSLEVIGEANE